VARRTSTSAGDEVNAWVERNCAHVKGEWQGQAFKLADWQADLGRDLFGTLQRDGRRQYRTALIGVPRKNGKSFWGAAIALRLLFRDGEPGAEVYSAAADRDQAGIVFEMARGMVEANPKMSGIAKVYRRSIAVPRTGSVYKVLSADAYTKHGLSPHGVIFDELHAQPNRELWDVLTTGQGARRQPLTVAITTAGADRTSVCWELFEYGRKLRAGLIEDPTFFFRWWGALDGDDWRDEATWERANPNLGVSISRDFLRAEARQAEHQPARQNTFRRLYCNEWTQQVTRFIDLARWDGSAGMVVEENLAGAKCIGGLSLARTSGVAALVWDFQREDRHEILWRLFVPADMVAELDAETAGEASVWVKQGFLRATPGDVVDYEAIRSQVLADEKRFDVESLVFNRRGAVQLAQDLEGSDLGLVEMTPGVTLAAATQELERLVLNRAYVHGGNPVVRWMVDGLAVKTDSEGNSWPDQGKSSTPQSAIIAAVMALDRSIRSESSDGVPLVGWGR